MDLQNKYQILASEFSKVRGQVTVLKKAVLDEQSKGQQLQVTSSTAVASPSPLHLLVSFGHVRCFSLRSIVYRTISIEKIKIYGAMRKKSKR
jgi:hypothetical protein